jgi:hypothetical protein
MGMSEPRRTQDQRYDEEDDHDQQEPDGQALRDPDRDVVAHAWILPLLRRLTTQVAVEATTNAIGNNTMPNSPPVNAATNNVPTKAIRNVTTAISRSISADEA